MNMEKLTNILKKYKVVLESNSNNDYDREIDIINMKVGNHIVELFPFRNKEENGLLYRIGVTLDRDEYAKDTLGTYDRWVGTTGGQKFFVRIVGEVFKKYIPFPIEFGERSIDFKTSEGVIRLVYMKGKIRVISSVKNAIECKVVINVGGVGLVMNSEMAHWILKMFPKSMKKVKGMKREKLVHLFEGSNEDDMMVIHEGVQYFYENESGIIYKIIEDYVDDVDFRMNENFAEYVQNNKKKVEHTAFIPKIVCVDAMKHSMITIVNDHYEKLIISEMKIKSLSDDDKHGYKVLKGGECIVRHGIDDKIVVIE